MVRPIREYGLAALFTRPGRKVAPYLGARGGRTIDPMWRVTHDDVVAHRTFDDVIYVYFHDKSADFCDVPYRIMLPKKIEGYDYPGHYLVRRVSRAGTIRVLSKQIFVSHTLREEYVGLEEVADGIYDVYFRFYQIGRYDLREKRIQDIVSRVAVSRRQVDLASRV